LVPLNCLFCFAFFYTSLSLWDLGPAHSVYGKVSIVQIDNKKSTCHQSSVNLKTKYFTNKTIPIILIS
jgi:hypothetical protein